MDPYYSDESVTVFAGDCVEVLAGMETGSIDAVVTDPPYGLGFMGKDWDSPGGTGDFPMRRFDAINTVNTGASRQGGRQRSSEDWAKRQARDARAYGEWCELWAAECLRVLKPGGHLLAFGGTRTYHRIACAVEDVGFEVRDSIDQYHDARRRAESAEAELSELRAVVAAVEALCEELLAEGLGTVSHVFGARLDLVMTSAALAAGSADPKDTPTPEATTDRRVKEMSHHPHPFHIIGECQDCCDESEALRLGCPEVPVAGDCETPGCINGRPSAAVTGHPTDEPPTCEHGESGPHTLWLDHKYWDDGHGFAEHAPWCKCQPRVCPGPAGRLVPQRDDDECDELAPIVPWGDAQQVHCTRRVGHRGPHRSGQTEWRPAPQRGPLEKGDHGVPVADPTKED